MISALALVSLAVGSVAAQGGASDFNVSSLSLREVGARNTLVCASLWQFLKIENSR